VAGLSVPLPEGKLLAMSGLGLAYIGDAVFELMVRAMLCAGGRVSARAMHAAAVGYVSARAQARAMRRLLPVLNEEERAVYMRGRNAHVHSMARGSSQAEYHAATGLEALFGYLYLQNKSARLHELFELAVSETDGVD
jgi:ribonuclease-3 family protein